MSENYHPPVTPRTHTTTAVQVSPLQKHGETAYRHATCTNVATEKPRLFVDPDHVLTTSSESVLVPGTAIGLAWQNAECPSATALYATNGDVFVGIAANQALEFLKRHADRLLIPSEPGWFLEIHGHAAGAWEVVPGQDAPVFAAPFVNLAMLAWALRRQNERPFGLREETLAQEVSFAHGTGKGERLALRGLLEAGQTAYDTGLRGRLAGQAAAALRLYRLLVRSIQHRGPRRDTALARLARYRPQMPAALQEQLYGTAQSVTSTSIISG